MGSCFSWPSCSSCPSCPSSSSDDDDLDDEKEALSLLDKWAIEIYSRNPYLYAIPEQRKIEKFEEIRIKLKGKIN